MTCLRCGSIAPRSEKIYPEIRPRGVSSQALTTIAYLHGTSVTIVLSMSQSGPLKRCGHAMFLVVKAGHIGAVHNFLKASPPRKPSTWYDTRYTWSEIYRTNHGYAFESAVRVTLQQLPRDPRIISRIGTEQQHSSKPTKKTD